MANPLVHMMNPNPLIPLPQPLSGLALLSGFRRVPDNCVVTVHRFGRYVGALGAGWRWTVPGVDHLGTPVCLIGHHLDVPDATGAHAELYYQILDPSQAGEALDRVDALVSDQARDALASLPRDAMPSLADALKAELNRRIGNLGLRVIRCALHPA
jgi:regulator of protease activity HflC (stomatin/prohibitin superfamily)